MAFLALCDKFIENPELLNYDNFQKDNSVENLSTAFELAEKHMGVPKLLDPNVSLFFFYKLINFFIGSS